MYEFCNHAPAKTLWKSSELGIFRILIFGFAILFSASVGIFAQTTDDTDALLAKIFGERARLSSLFGPKLEDPALLDLIRKDETGLWEWRKEKTKPCPIRIADGKRHPFLCRHCGGKKRKLRLSEEAPCLACLDGKIRCHVCNGSGRLLVTGGFSSGLSPTSCPGCAGKGKFKCTICRGRRVVLLGRVNGKKIRDAKESDLKKRYKKLKSASGEVLAAMRSGTSLAVAKARKLKGKVKYAPAHVALMTKLQKNQNRMKGFIGSSSFQSIVRDRFEKMIVDQINREIVVLEHALQRYKWNAKVVPVEK